MKHWLILPVVLIVTSACAWLEHMPYNPRPVEPPVAVESSSSHRVQAAYALLDAIEDGNYPAISEMVCPALLAEFNPELKPIAIDDVWCWEAGEQVLCSMGIAGLTMTYAFGFESGIICSLEPLSSSLPTPEPSVYAPAPCAFDDAACYGVYLRVPQSYGPFSLPTIGSGTASVVVRVFMDFMCPHCANFSDDLEQLIDDYGDEVRFEYFPMAFVRIPQSEDAAKVALCAKEQNRFWQYQAALFSELREGNLHDRDATLDYLIDFGAARGLNADDLSACLKTANFKYMLDGSRGVAADLHINSTPTVVVSVDSGNTWQQQTSATYAVVAATLDAALGR